MKNHVVIALLACGILMLDGCSAEKKPKPQGEADGVRLRVDNANGADSALLVPDKAAIDDDMSHLPQFKGGVEAMEAYVKSHVRMPEAARLMKREGKVVVTAHVGSNGNVDSCTVLSSDDAVFDEEAMRVVRSMPRFIPAKRGGKNVSADCNIAVMFRLK